MSYAMLPRRLGAAGADMLLLGVICFGMYWAMRMSDPPRTSWVVIFASLLGILVIVELLIGWTPGKQLNGLQIQARDGKRPTLVARIIRGIVRLLPLGMFLPALFVRNELLSLTIWGISLTVVCCYVCTAYLTLMRSGVTPFDAAAGTMVIDRKGS